MTVMRRSATAMALTLGTFACDIELDPVEAVAQALNAEDAAVADEGAGAADGEDREGRHRPPACRGDRPPPQGFEDIEVAACAPPVGDDVDLGRAPPHRGHLAPIYDADESHTLEEAELTLLQADLTAGCGARNGALLADFDVDADGVLSQIEWDSARIARRAAHDEERDALDTDGNGELSRDEHDAARAALIATWDADEDGELSAEERIELRADMQALVRAGDPLPPLPLGPPDGPRPPCSGDAGPDEG